MLLFLMHLMLTHCLGFLCPEMVLPQPQVLLQAHGPHDRLLKVVMLA